MRLLLAFCLLGTSALAGPDAAQLHQEVLKVDAWGLAGADVSAKATIRDGKGGLRELLFSARSRRYAPPLAKSLVRFSAPADVAGVGFLQVEKKDGDDDRHLFLPDLKKSRRIVGDLRSKAFMGTDFSYADLDRRDFRDSDVKLAGEESLGKFPCYRLEALPRAKDAQYSKMEVWVRKDNFVPLKWNLFDRSGKHVKTLAVQEVKRVSGKWFITRSTMSNLADARATELVIDKVAPRDDIPDDEFTVRNLEKT